MSLSLNYEYKQSDNIKMSRRLPDLEQITTLSPAFRNSLAKAYPIPELKGHVIKGKAKPTRRSREIRRMKIMVR